MKVLHVFKTYKPDSFAGIERVIWELAEGATDQGIESHVFFVSDTPADKPYRIARHWVHAARRDLHVASTSLSLSAFRAFSVLARQMDVIHYHFPWPMMDLLDLAARHDRPSLVTYPSDIVKQKALRRLYTPLMRLFLGRMDSIVATSPQYAASSATLARYADKVSVIPIGLDTALLTPPDPERIAHWQARLGRSFFLFIGAFRYYKGLEFLIEAARKADVPIAIAGAGTDALLSRRDLPPGVTVLGAIDEGDKAALLFLAQAFVFPSHLRSEAFGVALLEAAFAEKALISCEIGTGTSYINIDGETGLVIPPADADALARAMQTLSGDPALRTRFGAAARARAERLFRADTMTDAYVALYRRLGAPGA